MGNTVSNDTISNISNPSNTTNTNTSSNDNNIKIATNLKLDGIALPLPPNRSIDSIKSSLIEIRDNRRLSILYIPSTATTTSGTTNSKSDVTVFLIHG